MKFRTTWKAMTAAQRKCFLDCGCHDGADGELFLDSEAGLWMHLAASSMNRKVAAGPKRKTVREYARSVNT